MNQSLPMQSDKVFGITWQPAWSNLRVPLSSGSYELLLSPCIVHRWCQAAAHRASGIGHLLSFSCFNKYSSVSWSSILSNSSCEKKSASTVGRIGFGMSDSAACLLARSSAFSSATAIATDMASGNWFFKNSNLHEYTDKNYVQCLFRHTGSLNFHAIMKWTYSALSFASSCWVRLAGEVFAGLNKSTTVCRGRTGVCCSTPSRSKVLERDMHAGGGAPPVRLLPQQYQITEQTCSVTRDIPDAVLGAWNNLRWRWWWR